MSYNIPFKTKDNIPNIYEHWIARETCLHTKELQEAAGDRADFLQIIMIQSGIPSRDSLCDATVAFDEWIKLFDEAVIAERIEKLEYDMKLISRMNPYASINYIRRGIG